MARDVAPQRAAEAARGVVECDERRAGDFAPALRDGKRDAATARENAAAPAGRPPVLRDASAVVTRDSTPSPMPDPTPAPTPPPTRAPSGAPFDVPTSAPIAR